MTTETPDLFTERVKAVARAERTVEACDKTAASARAAQREAYTELEAAHRELHALIQSRVSEEKAPKDGAVTDERPMTAMSNDTEARR